MNKFMTKAQADELDYIVSELLENSLVGAVYKELSRSHQLQELLAGRIKSSLTKFKQWVTDHMEDARSTTPN